MRDTVGGLLMLFGILIIGMGIWEAVFEDTGEAWQTALTGIVIVAAGFFIVTRQMPVPGGSGAATPDEDAGNVPIYTATGKEPAESGPAEARFTIIQSYDDGVLDRIVPILEADGRITSIVEEGGRWYSTPDRDDLPEWFALRVYCVTGDLDGLMDEMGRTIETRLGKEAASKVSIRHY